MISPELQISEDGGLWGTLPNESNLLDLRKANEWVENVSKVEKRPMCRYRVVGLFFFFPAQHVECFLMVFQSLRGQTRSNKVEQGKTFPSHGFVVTSYFSDFLIWEVRFSTLVWTNSLWKDGAFLFWSRSFLRLVSSEIDGSLWRMELCLHGSGSSTGSLWLVKTESLCKSHRSFHHDNSNNRRWGRGQQCHRWEAVTVIWLAAAALDYSVLLKPACGMKNLKKKKTLKHSNIQCTPVSLCIFVISTRIIFQPASLSRSAFQGCASLR